MDGALTCNLKRCRRAISAGQVWVTSCSHLFCAEDGETLLVNQKKCPVCDHLLGGKLDIVRVDLNPSEAYKSMVLCGLHPDIIMDISSRAINFWMFQSRQEYLLKEHQLAKISDKYAKLEKHCNKMMNNWQHESKGINAELLKSKNELELCKRRCEELNELLRDKSRQLQKVQSSFSAHRHNSLQKELSHSAHSSPRKGVRSNFRDITNRRPEYSSYDLPLGCLHERSPPERDNRNFESAFRFNVSSIPPSPMIQRHKDVAATHETKCSH